MENKPFLVGGGGGSTMNMNLNIILLFNLLTLSVPDEGNSTPALFPFFFVYFHYLVLQKIIWFPF